MFAAFERLDCEQNKCKSGLYDAAQAQFLGYRTSHDHTNRRCYRDPVKEAQLWQEQYTTRFYTPKDCAKPPAAKEACIAMQVDHRVGFAEVTKEKRPMYDEC